MALEESKSGNGGDNSNNDNNNGAIELTVLFPQDNSDTEEMSEEDEITLSLKEKTSVKLHSLIKRKHFYNISLVFLMICIIFPIYITMELPSGMERTIIEVMSLTTAQYTILYGLFFWPSIIMSPISGTLIDKFKTERMLPLFMTITFVGQCVWTLGGFTGQYWLMAIGRTCSGGGGEMIFICLVAYVVKCFPSNINLVNGILLGMGRLGATTSVNVHSLMYSQLNISNHYHRTGYIYLFSVGLLGIGLLCSLLLWYLYIHGSQYRVVVVSSKVSSSTSLCTKLKGCTSSFLVYYLLIIFISGIFYAAVLNPGSIGEIYYMQKFGLSLTLANFINSLIHILPIGLCPLFGFIINRSGHNLLWVLTSICIGTLSHVILAYGGGQPWYAYVGSITAGISYSMFTTSIWPLLSLIIRPELLGLAYGVQGSVIGMIQVVVSFPVGLIADSKGYFMVQLFYFGLSMIALSAAIIVNCIDLWIEGRRVNVSGKRQYKIN